MLKIIIIFILILVILAILLSTNILENYTQLPRIAVLIISIKDLDQRYQFEKSIWEKYLKTNPAVDCFFIECDPNQTQTNQVQPQIQVDRQSATITSKCIETYIPGIYQKSLLTLKELSGKYDYYLRTNLSTFVIFPHLIKRLDQLHVNQPIFAGTQMDQTWVSGTSILLNQLAVNILLKHGFADQYFRNPNQAPDDVLIGNILHQHSPVINLKDWLYWWKWNQSFEKNQIQIERNQYPCIRTRPSDNDPYKSREILSALLKEYYPQIQS